MKQEAANPKEVSDDLKSLRLAMADLPQEMRAMLSLRYLEGMSLSEIGRILGIKTGTVKSRLWTAREELRTVLNGEAL